MRSKDHPEPRVAGEACFILQGFPDWFDFGTQPDSATYRQLGNAVAVGVARYVFLEHLRRDHELLTPSLRAVYTQATGVAGCA